MSNYHKGARITVFCLCHEGSGATVVNRYAGGVEAIPDRSKASWDQNPGGIFFAWDMVQPRRNEVATSEGGMPMSEALAINLARWA